MTLFAGIMVVVCTTFTMSATASHNPHRVDGMVLGGVGVLIFLGLMVWSYTLNRTS